MNNDTESHHTGEDQSPEPFVVDNLRGSVTIYFVDKDNVTIVPALGLLDRHVQTMQWTLVDGNGDSTVTVRFGEPGIIFKPADGTTVAWPGQTPERVNDWQYRAAVDFILKPGDEAQKYAYDIYVVDPVHGEIRLTQFFDYRRMLIDPDMENQPRP